MYASALQIGAVMAQRAAEGGVSHVLPPSLEMGWSLTGSTTVRPLGLVPATPSCTWNFTISANNTVVVSAPCTPQQPLIAAP